MRDAVLRSAARLFAERGTAASLRDIADDAGVNLGLIHRHIGNKDDVLRAVLAESAARGRVVIESAPSVVDAVDQVLRATSDDDAHVRIVAWLLLQGTPIEDFQAEFPAIQALRERAEREGVDELDVLASFALVYGWSVFASQLQRAFAVAAADRPVIEQHLRAALARILGSPAVTTV